MRGKSSAAFGVSIVFVMSQALSMGGGLEGLGFLPGGSCSEAAAVSADGSVVVGTSCTASGVRAFRWTAADGITEIPIPAGPAESWATGVSADGSCVSGYGKASDSPPYGYQGFRYHISGRLEVIAMPGLDVIAKDISGDGSIVVGTSWGTGVDDEAFYWTEDAGLARPGGLAGGASRTNAEAISQDGLVIVGDRIYDGAPYRDCFVWNRGEAVGFSAHTANATSSDGTVVVGGLDNHDTSLFEAYRWTAETGTVLLGTCLPNYHSRALCVSGDGSIIVGYVQNNSGFDEQKAFIRDRGHGMRLLQDVLEDDYGFDLSGWKLDEPWASWKATGISRDGSTIVGVALNAEGQREAWRAVLRKVVYVDRDAAGANNGSSWANAYNYLQDALMFAVAGDEIRVAQGVYRPDEFVLSRRANLGREETFRLISNVALKGGYAGLGEPDPNARDIELYETILSGDRDGNDVEPADPCDLINDPRRGENCHRVVTAFETDNTAILEGFTITGGNADSSGGGMYISNAGPIVSRCTFRRNSAPNRYGGGIGCFHSSSTLTACVFVCNSGWVGGGMWNSNSQTTVTNCIFNGNYAVWYGGGMYNDYNYERSMTTVTGCEFTGNSAECGGAIAGGNFLASNCRISGNTALRGAGLGVYGYYDDQITISDCEITDNIAQSRGGGIYSDCGRPTISNCIISGNYAGSNGGGICSFGDSDPSDPTLICCMLTGNYAGANGGGICSHFNSSPKIGSCAVIANRAQQGGGMYIGDWTDPVLRNCTFSGNLARDCGGAIYGDAGGYDTLTVTNSILWADTPDEVYQRGTNVAEVFQEYNNIQGGWPGDANIGADPCFAALGYWDPNETPEDTNDDFWVHGDYHLKSQAGRWDPNSETWFIDDVTSPCIDAGDPMMSPIGREPFPNGGIVNMGAYGGTAEASKTYFGGPPCEIILAGDINGDCKINFEDFRLMALHWMEDRNL